MNAERTCLVFGAGALGLGFLGPELAGHYRMVFADINLKADLLSALHGDGRYCMNESGPACTTLEIAGVDAVNLEAEPERLAHEVRNATLIFTAVGEPNLGKVAPVIAQAHGGVIGRDLRVLCCENGIHIAEKMRGHLKVAFGGQVPRQIRVSDTVMGRMCQFLPEGHAPWQPIHPGLAAVVVGEPFYGMPVEAHCMGDLPDPGDAFQICDGPRFEALEDLKMFSHNGLHAFLASLGTLRSREFFCDLTADAEVMALTRQLMVDEIGPAMFVKHRGAMDRNEYLNYVPTIIRRILCPGLHDAIARGTRGMPRKLLPWERFISGIRCVREQGGRPAVYCRGLAAAIRVARLQNETTQSLAEVLHEVCELDPRADAELIELTHDGERWLDREFLV